MDHLRPKFTVQLVIFMILLSVLGISSSSIPNSELEEGDLSEPFEPEIQTTQWRDPCGSNSDLHEIPYSLDTSRISLKSSRSSDDSRGRVALIVEENLYDNIESELNRHIDNLLLDGLDVVLITFSGTAEDFRDLLIDMYSEPESLLGAKLIGDVPYIIYEMDQSDYTGFPEYETFPSDLFYMDLEGTWEDTNNSGYYDSWTGDRSLDIWVSRMKTDNLDSLGCETDIMIDYFEKNHAYRIGDLRPEQKGLAYIDNDWEHMGLDDQNNLEMIYDNVIMENDPDKTTATDYIGNRMPKDQEMIFTRSHGWPEGHSYNDGGQYDYVFNSNYRDILPPALFYHLFVCSGTDFTYDDNLGSTIAFNDGDSGLLSWGSTKTGGMLEDQHFYMPLSDGDDFGEAFVGWFNKVKDLYYAPPWFYGMVLLGDGSLRPSPFFEPTDELLTRDIELSANPVSDGWNFVSFNLGLKDNDMESILEDQDNGIPGSYEKVIYYDAQNDIWRSYYPERDEQFNQLTLWDHNMGVWIQMNNNDILTLEGNLLDVTSIILKPGWNMIGYPSESISNHSLPEEVEKIGYFDADAHNNIAYDFDTDNFEFKPDEGYYLYNGAEEDILWTVEY